MVEPTVSDLPRSIAWYSDVLGLKLTLLDDANGFALLEGAPGRISLKRGTPKAGEVRLHFEVGDLDAELVRIAAFGFVPVSAIKSSDEGYRRAVLHDPDGHEVALFEWAADLLARRVREG
jgi:catechol 2,3-dioxygenase-like lactoylglutathione lyase family enzyme